MNKLSPNEVRKIEQELESSSLDEATQNILKGIITGQVFLLDFIKNLLQASGSLRIKLMKELAKILEIELKKNLNPPSSEGIFDENKEAPKEDFSKENREMDPTQENKENNNKEDLKKHPKRKNHEYKPVDSHVHFHQDLEPGDQCPKCLIGKVYPFREKIIPILIGRSPLAFEEHRLQTLRCNACGEIFEPDFPEGIPKDGFSKPSAQAALILLHYKVGVPFASITYMQKMFQQDISPGQLWEIIEQAARAIKPIYKELSKQAANSKLFYTDDTSSRILSHYPENKKNREKKGRNKDPKDRVGTYSTLIIGCTPLNHEIYLFFNGRKYAGENLKDLLINRDQSLEKPIQMKDASTMNIPNEIEIIEVKCNAHALRKFKDQVELYPEECGKILKKYRQVNKNNQMLLKKGASDVERFVYHQKYSYPVMEEIKTYTLALIKGKRVEPNSSLGKAISYFLSHYKELIAFCTIKGAPFDNNKSERGLKMIIRLRKTSMFYKTEHGAEIAGMLQSVLYTAQEAEVNVLDYLNTILENREKIRLNPKSYLPWTYQKTLLEQEKEEIAFAIL